MDSNRRKSIVDRSEPVAVAYVRLLWPMLEKLDSLRRHSGESNVIDDLNYTWNNNEYCVVGHLEIWTDSIAGCLSHGWPIKHADIRAKLIKDLEWYLPSEGLYGWLLEQGNSFPHTMAVFSVLETCLNALLFELRREQAFRGEAT